MRSATRIGARSVGAAAAVLLLGCVTANQNLQRWVGSPIADVVAARGPATRIVAYPYGGRLYIWEQELMTPSAGDTTGQGAETGMRDGVRVVREIALVGDDGVVIRTQVESTSRSATPPF